MAETHRWLLTRDFSFMWWSQVLSQVAEGISQLTVLSYYEQICAAVDS